MRTLRQLAAFGFLSIASATSALAQRVRGIAVRSDSVTPLAGAIVVAKDARDSTVAQGLTKRTGEFTIELPKAGRYQLTLLRIGYRPTLGPKVDVAVGATESVTIVFTGQAINLAAMNTRERETCRIRADSGFMVARVWEEARKAMITTRLSDGSAPLVAEWVEYDRTTDPSARLVRQQRVKTSRNPTTHAFKSQPAAALHEKGYIIVEGDATTYYAPDADALLSDAFMADHCFHLVAPTRDRANLIGVGFQPERQRRDARDIEGTLWVDRATSELRALEFNYTNMPDIAEAAHAGGRVQFLRVSEGNWLIDRWNVRMPQLGPIDRITDAGTRRIVMAKSNLELRGVQFTGGEVTRVFQHDTLLYQAKGPTLSVQILAADSLLPASGAIVSLEGTDYEATADASGRVRLSPVLAGRYRVRVHTPLMDTLHVAPVAGEVEVREASAAVHVDSLKLPSSREALAGACPRDSIRNGAGLLRGRALDTHAQPLAHATISVTWQSDFKATVAEVGFAEHTLGALSGTNGYWQICGVPKNYALAVRLMSDSGVDVRRARLEEGESLGSLDLIAHAESKASREVATAVSPVPRARALVEFAVVDTRGQPLATVALDIDAPGGIKRTLVTGPSGHALIPELPPGRLSVRARRLGFKEGEVIAFVEPGNNTVPIVLSEISVPMLDTVRVVGDRRVLSGRGRFDEFEQRRALHQATVSFSREEIVKRNPVSLWQMLNGVPSIKVVDVDTMVIVMSTRTNLQNFKDSPQCYLAVGLNGQLMAHDVQHLAVDLRTLPVVDEVYGIEVFAGATSIPLQYGGVGEGKWCGMIMIWTR